MRGQTRSERRSERACGVYLYSYAPARTRLQSHLEHAVANAAPEVNAEDGISARHVSLQFAWVMDHPQIRLWPKFQLVDHLAHEAAASARVESTIRLRGLRPDDAGVPGIMPAEVRPPPDSR